MTLAALFASTLLWTTPTLAETQTVPSQTPATTPAGLSIPQMTTFLTTEGLTVGPVEQNGDQRFAPVSDGPVRFVVFFQSCEGDVCSDLQFSLGTSNAGVTADGVNRWNRERRFLKAFYEAPASAEATPSAVVQYDVFLNAVQGPEQLADPLAIWRNLAPQFPGAVSTPAP